MINNKYHYIKHKIYIFIINLSEDINIYTISYMPSQT